tara:strand:+ start:12519 stop:12866 length:348 start_codon:yes stop_codon:yes gene_type:complete
MRIKDLTAVENDLPNSHFEAWVSESIKSLEIGMQVEVTAGIAECCFRGESESPLKRASWTGHSPSLFGREGMLYRFMEIENDPDHKYVVSFNEKYEWIGEKWTSEIFTASELKAI